MPEVSYAEWQAFVSARPGTHVLQTGEWGELKSEFGWSPVRLIRGETGLQILFRKLPLGLSVGYAPKVFTGGEQFKGDAELWQEIDRICRGRRAVFCKFEADAWENQALSGMDNSARMTSGRNIQPPRTIIVDLSGTEEQILARMKQKARYNIRLAEKKGVTVQPWSDLDAFHKMLRITGGRDRFGVHSRDYYQRAYELFHPAGMAELLVAMFDGRPLAALMVFAHGSRAWYMYGASTDEERNRMPTYLLQWEAMRWAMQRGCREYDLWGVPDEPEEVLEANFETRTHGLWGVYRFKRGFGGRLARAEPAQDRVYSPLLYKLYTLRSSTGDAG